MEAENVYVFGGNKFLDYVNLKDFKAIIEKELEYFEGADNFPDYYTNFISTQSKPNIYIFNKLFFEHLLYGRLTNIYIYKLENSFPAAELFLKRVERVIDKFKVNLSIPLQNLVTTKGFYLMDMINVSIDGANFIAGFDYKEENGLISEARFLFGRNVYRKKQNGDMRNEFLLSGVDINFAEKYCAILTRNTNGVTNLNETEIRNLNNINNFLKLNVLQELSVNSDLKPKEDQEGMFKMCQFLLGHLINDMKEKVFETTSQEVNKSVRIFSRILTENDEKIPQSDLENIKKKIKFLLLGLFINNNYDEKDMRLKAREHDLIGYPTKISFKNTKMNRSSTGTNTAKKSIASSDVLYSLLTDFENSNKLSKWSMSWFTDYNNKDDLDVIQTTIESSRTAFKITNVALRHLNKELIQHVIRNVNEYRNY
ncbi:MULTISPECIES: hypothetical protein [Paenibacillus]|uniref:hypothetical protein n=1 Tax=Paenibacillus TaxID=44249 RepID=UPI0013537492|nr:MULTISPECIES: hypothetical protein [Paenibacillus]MDY8025808.1 hypothetical protein [Paenibacillus polymyxa]MXO77700.1 hypothetical protein [Paenibacillus sp. OT2-17]